MRVSWEQVSSDIQNCYKCPLGASCTRKVPGEGSSSASVMFVGEGPGADEDRTGRPFVGAAGQLLTRMIEAIGFGREQVYIANVVKCRPPQNRVPLDSEVEACLPHLRAQTALIRPKIIVCLGATACKAILDPNIRITKDRGRWTVKKGVYFMPTYHPSALLRDETKKRPAWEDFKAVRDKLAELADRDN